jgi:hypothetical protein
MTFNRNHNLFRLKNQKFRMNKVFILNLYNSYLFDLKETLDIYIL